ncbi:hypothetical protein GCM10023160_01930 [Brachybacterium paraconglomeratum]|uniref:hypothetical protein n=1 Tax=Brachybacterium paraconglomeratum TaxID=173362 RepID=UPI0031EBAFAD
MSQSSADPHHPSRTHPSRTEAADPSAPGAVPDLPAGLGSSDPEAPVPYTASDVTAAAEVLARAAEGEPELLVALTDEQLAALDGYARRQFVATPWLDEHPDQRRFAAGVGLRALIAAGLVGAVAAPGGDQQWTADPKLAGCLVLRRTASLFTTAERTVQSPQGPEVHRLHYYVHEGGVLEEEVTALGIHRFTPLVSAQVNARLLAFVDPAGVAVGRGEPVQVRASELAASQLAQRLAATRALTVFTLVTTTDGGVRQTSVYATGDEVLVMEALDPGAEDPRLEFRSVDSAELHALATVLVGAHG